MPDRDGEVLDLAVVVFPTLLRDTDAPELAGARELLAAEESFAPLGLDEVLVLDSRSFRDGDRPEGTGFREAIRDAWGDRAGLDALVVAGTGWQSSLFLSVDGCRVIVLDKAPTAPARELRLGALATLEAAAMRAHDTRSLGQEALLARTLASTGLVAHAFLRSRSEGTLLRGVLAHEIGHARTVQAIGTMGFAEASGHWAPYGTPLGAEILRRGLAAPSLYAATNPVEWIAEAYALCVVGRCDEGNAALVEEVRECVGEGRIWEP